MSGSADGRNARAADIANFSLAHQIVQCAHGFLDGRQRISSMQLIQVYPVGFQALKAVLDCSHDITTRGALQPPLIVHGMAEFRRQDDVLASRAQCVAQHQFRRAGLAAAAPAIGVRRIEKCHTHIKCLVHDSARLRGIEASTEVIAAQTDC